MIENLIIKSKDERYQLVVGASGSKITVAKGPFKARAEEGSLADDYEYTLVSRSVICDVSGYLVKNRKTGEYEILVDEVDADGADLPHDFSTGDYAELALIFWAVVPANTASFDGLKVMVNQVVPRPPPPPRPTGPLTPQEGGAS